MEEDLILVTFNYRLGILGFYKTEDGTVSGNMGLKDQVLALKWVQENIEAFNGDPDRVTIMGVNSGAVSVNLHMLSEMSKGLFHRAVSQSGTALAPWAIVKEEKTSRIKKMLKKCKLESTTEVVACLKTLNASDIARIQPGFAVWESTC
jgi:carboxylesterase type B